MLRLLTILLFSCQIDLCILSELDKIGKQWQLMILISQSDGSENI